MTYAQIDDRFDEHPKYAAADFDLEHFGMQACAITYCNRHLTDGRIPDAAVRKMGRGNARRNLALASHLVDVGIWRRVDGGFEIVGFLDHNSSRAEVLSRREDLHEKRAAAGRIGGLKSAAARKEQGARGQATRRASAKAPPKQLASPVLKQNEALSSPLRSSPIRSPEDPRSQSSAADAAPTDFQRVIACYAECYASAKGAKPAITARTGKAAKDLLAQLGVEDACAVIRGAFTDDFFARTRGELWDISNGPNRFRRVPAPAPPAPTSLPDRAPDDDGPPVPMPPEVRASLARLAEDKAATPVAPGADVRWFPKPVAGGKP